MCPRGGSRRRKTSLAIALAAFACCGSAGAQELVRTAAQNGPPSADRTNVEPTPRPWRVGAIGGVGFPRPLAIEAMALVHDTAALGVEYGALPPTTIGGVQASLWSLAGDARVFPFRGAFFIGLRTGYQHLAAATTVVVGSIGAAPEELALDSWFFNPRLGFLWISQAGLAFGVEAGAQIPIHTAVSSTLPLSLAPSIRNTVDSLGGSVLPTVDLLRVGLVL
jgi:hypothetical protein